MLMPVGGSNPTPSSTATGHCFRSGPPEPVGGNNPTLNSMARRAEPLFVRSPEVWRRAAIVPYALPSPHALHRECPGVRLRQRILQATCVPLSPLHRWGLPLRRSGSPGGRAVPFSSHTGILPLQCERESERRALTWRVAQANLPLMLLDEPSGGIQSQPQSSRLGWL
jgi:hypothetical protein